MKRLSFYIALFLMTTLLLSCSPRGNSIQVSFDFDRANASDWTNIYVIWLENGAGEIQNLYVCNRLLDGSITDPKDVLPFWQLHRKHRAEFDAVTGATKANRDFTVKADISGTLGDRFTLYFEIDQSFQFNDWFPGAPYQMTDQPSVLYSVDIDLTSPETDYTLTPRGFTPMYDYAAYSKMKLTTADEEAVRTGAKTFAKGVLFPELRYITHAMATDASGNRTFGAPDPAQSAIRSVGGITAEIIKK